MEKIGHINIIKFLHIILEDTGIKLIDIARKTGISKQNLSRILSGEDIKISQLILILESINMSVTEFAIAWYNHGYPAGQHLYTVDDIEEFKAEINRCKEEIKSLQKQIDLSETLIQAQKKIIDNNDHIILLQDTLRAISQPPDDKLNLNLLDNQ